VGLEGVAGALGWLVGSGHDEALLWWAGPRWLATGAGGLLGALEDGVDGLVDVVAGGVGVGGVERLDDVGEDLSGGPSLAEGVGVDGLEAEVGGGQVEAVGVDAHRAERGDLQVAVAVGVGAAELDLEGREGADVARVDGHADAVEQAVASGVVEADGAAGLPVLLLGGLAEGAGDVDDASDAVEVDVEAGAGALEGGVDGFVEEGDVDDGERLSLGGGEHLVRLLVGVLGRFVGGLGRGDEQVAGLVALRQRLGGVERLERGLAGEGGFDASASGGGEGGGVDGGDDVVHGVCWFGG